MSDTYRQNIDDLLRNYFGLLVAWNKKINLTSIDDEEGFRTKHVDDCLRTLPYLSKGSGLLDLGTGAGIPGIILKIERDDLDVTLLDSTRKKISFCDEAIRRLALPQIRTLWGRAEDPKIMAELGKFDVVISRATWALTDFLEIASPYLRSGGRLIAMKGARWSEELGAAKEVLGRIGFILNAIDEYTLKSGEARCLLIFTLLRRVNPL